MAEALAERETAEFVWHGQTFVLFGDRAAFLPAESMLLVADLHWGKDETFRRYGVPLPGGLLDAELVRLRELLERSGARQLVVLGDLVHHAAGVTLDVIDEVARWRQSIDATIGLVRGNHDTCLRGLPADWHMDDLGEELEVSGFSLRHDPVAEDGRRVIGGHLHPTVRVGRGQHRTKLPCFIFGPSVCVLPAFTHFAGGGPTRPSASDRVFACVEGSVVEV